MKRHQSEKIWIVDYFRVRRHSRVLYLPLDMEIAQLYDIRKGDLVKAMLVEIVKAPRDGEDEI